MLLPVAVVFGNYECKHARLSSGSKSAERLNSGAACAERGRAKRAAWQVERMGCASAEGGREGGGRGGGTARPDACVRQASGRSQGLAAHLWRRSEAKNGGERQSQVWWDLMEGRA